MRRVGWVLLIVALAASLSACSKQSASGYGTLRGRVTYAKSAEQPLTDAGNVGGPATDVKVRVRLLEEPHQSGGQPLYLEGEPLFELTLDEKGEYTLELPQGQYLLEVVGEEGTVLTKRIAFIEPGKTFRADFNLAPSP